MNGGFGSPATIDRFDACQSRPFVPARHAARRLAEHPTVADLIRFPDGMFADRVGAEIASRRHGEWNGADPFVPAVIRHPPAPGSTPRLRPCNTGPHLLGRPCRTGARRTG